MMELLDPTLEVAPQSVTYAPRPLSLRGKRIGLVENTKINSDRLLQKIGDILKAEYGVTETHMWRKQNSSVPAHDQIITELRATCDAMVAGIGD
jgi:hypothetical protein